MHTLSRRERWDAALHAHAYIDYGPPERDAGERHNAANHYAPSRDSVLRKLARVVVGLGLEGAAGQPGREQAKKDSTQGVRTSITRFFDGAYSSVETSATFAPHRWVGPRHFIEMVVGKNHEFGSPEWTIQFNARYRTFIATDRGNTTYEVRQAAFPAQGKNEQRWLTDVRITADETVLDAAQLPPLMAVHHNKRLASAIAAAQDELPNLKPYTPTTKLWVRPS